MPNRPRRNPTSDKKRRGTPRPLARGVAELRALGSIDRTLTLAESFRVGQLVAGLAEHDRFAGASGGVWLRGLHRELDSGFSLASLHRHHAIYSMLERLRLDPSFQHLGRAHLRAIATLPERKQRAAIRRAEKEHWTSRQLEEWIAAERDGEDRGRRRLPAFAKRVRALRDFADVPMSTLIRLDGVDELDAAQIAELTKILRETARRTSRMLAKLEPRTGPSASS